MIMEDASTPILEFTEISKSFSGTQVLKDVSFELGRGETLGLVGENGAGKSTLMNILGGILPYEKGAMRLNGSAYEPQSPAEATESRVAFIHQELNLFNNLSIAENIHVSDFPCRRLLGIPYLHKGQINERAAQMLEAVELNMPPDTLVEQLSQGERQLVEIAKALSMEANIIIFDEPTSSLTSRETERLFGLIGRLREQGISIIYISHILDDVYQLCDRIVVLRDGEVAGSGAADTMGQSEAVKLMVGREIDQLYPERESHTTNEAILEVESLSQSGVVKDIDFSLHKGEILGIFGMMGSGRTELARILFGLDSFEQGKIIHMGERVVKPSPGDSIEKGIAFLTEDRRAEGLLMDKSIATNVSAAALPSLASTPARLVDFKSMRQKVHQIVQTLQIASSNPMEQPVQTLSGGNQQKVVFGKWLLKKPAVFIVDEPTRGIDVGAKYEAYKTINDLADNGTGILFISSELEELTALCDRILVMVYGEIRDVVDRGEFEQERILEAALGGIAKA